MDQKYLGEKAEELFRLWMGNTWNKGLLLIAVGISALVGWIDKPIRFARIDMAEHTPSHLD